MSDINITTTKTASPSPVFEPILTNISSTAAILNPTSSTSSTSSTPSTTSAGAPVPPPQFHTPTFPSYRRHEGLGPMPQPLSELFLLSHLDALDTVHSTIAYSSGKNNLTYFNHHNALIAFFFSICESYMIKHLQLYVERSQSFPNWVHEHFIPTRLQNPAALQFISEVVAENNLYEWACVTGLYVASVTYDNFHFARNNHTCVQTNTGFSMVIKNLLCTFYVGLFIQQLMPFLQSIEELEAVCQVLLIPQNIDHTLLLDIDLLMQGIQTHSLHQLVLVGARLYGRSTQFGK